MGSKDKIISKISIDIEVDENGVFNFDSSYTYKNSTSKYHSHGDLQGNEETNIFDHYTKGKIERILFELKDNCKNFTFSQTKN